MITRNTYRSSPDHAAISTSPVDRLWTPLWKFSAVSISMDLLSNCLIFRRLRYSAILLLFNSGADPFVVQKLAGHSDVRLTQPLCACTGGGTQEGGEGIGSDWVGGGRGL